ncbi:c-type cytochrome [Yoonia sediminilitoris]|uniref:Cytochrome c n=1 Tax=Yoonia sediminilitoris TaxID=1286148 RepID=A0A2T6K7H1_9RHOB|nr:c-type cytochrome [Yoonia sediminilitoris]PUB10668.1 cytochrome c [Yoonia sediminilitoris]RCW90420.1 cytochrome c [Yoonia sediminilitoris]
MFDTMTMTKTVGALCGSLLVFLLGGWMAELIYHSAESHDGEHAQAYVIEVAGSEADEEEVVEEVDFAVVMASASVEDGETLWRNCRSCHALEAGKHGTGPALYGVVNRPVAQYDDFNYSGALAAVAEVWTPENLNGFLEDPKGWAPGTAMGYNGMRKIEDRANLIAYLETVGD